MVTALRVRRPLVRAVGSERTGRSAAHLGRRRRRRRRESIRAGGRAGLGGHGPDLHLHGRALHQLHDYGDAEGAVSVGAVRRRRADPAGGAGATSSRRARWWASSRSCALPGVDAARAQHQLPAAADQWSDPAHLLADHRLCALPDCDTGEPPPDRPAVPRLRPGDPDRLPARDLWRLSPDQRCRPQDASTARASTRTTCATSCSTTACGRSSSPRSPPASPSATRCSVSSGW